MRSVYCQISKFRTNHSGAGELGDGLGALGHGVLSELPGQHQAQDGLDLPGGDSGPGRGQG